MKKHRAGPAAPSVTANTSTGERNEPQLGKAFPIVGVGASAGGLEAFTRLLTHLPLDTGMGFVLVQHLDPEHDSALTQLLARATSLPVREVTNNLRVEANHVYVIPPNTNLSIAGGVLHLQSRQQTRTAHRSIDAFFESLAEDQRERAIGVVLSGTASDGTLGLEAIKAEGGITFAQDDSARYDSMPRSAVAAGCVDFVLSPEQIASELARIAMHPAILGAGPSPAEGDRASAHEDDDTPVPPGGRRTPPAGAQQARAEAASGRGQSAVEGQAEDGFQKILLMLRNHAGVDFSLYKSSTIQRRIARRMVLTKHDAPGPYGEFLRENSKELDALYSDVLISVTSFFRNPEAFDVLQRKVWPVLMRQPGDAPIRVWTLGCSTGQEAYSIAMAFVESAAKAPRMRKLQVFATDLNDALLEKAREGLYAKSIAQDLSPERLRRFFVEEEGGYRISKALREMVVFARQNVISDPPFSRMDIISCRNLLIYFEAGLQKRVFPVFHYALKPGGFLYLGASESIGGFTGLFEPVDKKHKIYAKKASPTPAFQLPARQERREPLSAGFRQPAGPLRQQTEAGQATDGFRAELSAQREADRITIHQFAPPAVLINADLQILQFRGPTGAYLEPPSGKASFDVLKMARNGLMLPLRAAINEARNENRTARREHVRVDQDGTTRTINVDVIPLTNLRERCFLIVFEDAEKAADVSPARRSTRGARGPLDTPSGPTSRSPRGDRSRQMAELVSDLAETRDYLQAMQEQHEATNQELQAANEEVQSANEELQSINEELETSKEELESSNEELTTVNEEMGNRNAELNRLNSDLMNVQASAHLTIVLLGRDLTIRRFSAHAEKQFNLLAADVGRPLGNVRHNLDVPDLEAFIADVIDTMRARERDVQDAGGHWFSLRVRPYLTLDNKVDGAVLVLVDIDPLKRSAQTIAAARDYAEHVIETVREPMVVLDVDMRIERANRAFYDTFRVSPARTVGRGVFDLDNHAWDIPELRTSLETVLLEHRTIEGFSVEHDSEHFGRRTMLLNARRMHNPEHGADRILLAIEDITERSRADALIQEQRHILDLIAKGQPAERCLDELCLGIERMDSRVRACVLLADSERARFSSVTAPRLPQFAEAIRNVPVGDAWVATCAQAMVSGQPVTCADVANDARWQADFKSLCLAHGIRAGHSSPVFAADERAVGSVFLCFDVPREPTEWDLRLAAMGTDLAGTVLRRDQAEVALRESEARYRTLFESIDEGFCLIEKVEDEPGQPLDFRYLEANPAFGAHSGVSGVVGKTIREAFPGEAEEWFLTYDAALRTGEAIRFERGLVSQGRVLELYAFRVDDHGHRRVAVIFKDITERKRGEEALRESARHKNEFLAMLAHELRNPLAPICSSLDIMRRASGERPSTPKVAAQPGPEPESPGLAPGHSVVVAEDVLQRQIGQMVRLVDDLLDAGRISQGKLELRKEQVELSSVVHHAVDAAQPLVDAMGQALTVTLPPEPVYLHADSTRLAQIVGNLLSNASKFTGRGGRIWLTVEPGEESRADDTAAGALPLAPHVVIRVRDSGIGIADDQLSRVFDMFTQVDTSLERSVTGLGIGLTLVKTLAAMHGGTVDVHSAGLGHGSEFAVRLPTIVGTATSAGPPAADEPAVTAPLRVLIVDDNRDAADTLAMLLRFGGHETHTAHDGLAAVKAAAALQPDAIVLDIGLPGLNGYEVARRIRDHQRDGGPVLVALTGWGQDEDRRRSEEAGFDAHVVKPVDHVALGKLLVELATGNRDTGA